jgi:hypothetical protein
VTHRPYPNAARSLRQVERHFRTDRAPVSEFRLRLAASANAALAGADATGDVVRPFVEAFRLVRVDLTPMADALASIRRSA